MRDQRAKTTHKQHVGELIGSRVLPILMYRTVSIYWTMIYVALLVKYEIYKRLEVL